MILCWPLQYLRKIHKNRPDLNKAVWGLILRTSQTYYPIEKGKSWKFQQMQGIICIAPRLTTKDSLNIYGTSYIPKLSHEDPIFSKLLRRAHIHPTPTSHPVHLSLKGTQARLLKEPFGIYTQNMTSLIT